MKPSDFHFLEHRSAIKQEHGKKKRLRKIQESDDEAHYGDEPNKGAGNEPADGGAQTVEELEREVR